MWVTITVMIEASCTAEVFLKKKKGALQKCSRADASNLEFCMVFSFTRYHSHNTNNNNGFPQKKTNNNGF